MDASPRPSSHYLAWAGLSQSVELSPDDAGAMDIALALVPELRLAALAVVRARSLEVRYPITSAADVERLLGDERSITAGGHHIDAGGIRQYLVPGDLPIEHEGELVNVVYTGLLRCRRRQQLQQALDIFDADLSADPDADQSS